MVMTPQTATTTTPLVVPTDLNDRDARMEYVRAYSWAIPSLVALKAIQLASPLGVVEVGAGSGYWAALLEELGVRVAAFDIAPVPTWGPYKTDERNLNEFADRSWGHVRKAGAGVARDFPERTLMLCWPEYESPMAWEALSSYRGDTLVYIGELPGSSPRGYTPSSADADFFDLLEAEWSEVSEVAIPQWGVPHDGMHDTLTIWRRKTLQLRKIVDGPSKDMLMDCMADKDPLSITFTSEFGDLVEVFIVALERENGSGTGWNFRASLAGTNSYISGFYSTKTQQGMYRPATS